MRYCRYCGNSGHNRRTCPARSPEVKQADNEYHKRYRSNNRHCRYCHSTNHDRRKCEKLIADRVEWVKSNAEFRKRFLEDAKKAGWGVGAIIKLSYYGDESAVFYLITKVDWDSIVVNNRYAYSMGVMRIGNDGETNNFNPPRYFGIDNDGDREYFKKHNDMVIENPVSAETIEKSIPEDWLSGVCRKDKMPGSLQ